MNERIRKPRQERSQDTMVRILDAFEKLLRDRSYDMITINDIASKSSTGAGSIYARFDGKRSILLAVHERVRERARRYFRALFDPAKATEEPLETAIERIAKGILDWHTRHEHIIKTSLTLGDADIYQGISMSFRPYSAQLSGLLQSHRPVMTDQEAMETAVAILHIATAVAQQKTIFGKIAPIGHELTEPRLVGLIVTAALGQLPKKAGGAVD